MVKTSGKKSLLLISPGHAYRNLWTLKEVGELLGKGVTSYPLALPTLAAITPSHWDIRLIDEEMDEIPWKDKPDLVGVTAMVTNVKRAYEIADAYRAQGVTVVLGGPFTTLDWQESLAHADAVVLGEAEGIWQRLLADFEGRKLEQVYRAEQLPEVSRLPPPRWDLVDTSRVLGLNVQLSRGCPNNCEFCCVTKMFGKRQRYREVDNVIEEIRTLPLKQLSFVDDNLTSHKRSARELVEKLEPLGVSWTCLASLDVADDEALLEQMAKAGCNSILIGFESLDPKALMQAKKRHRSVETYGEVIRRIHAVGIHVIGAFVVGFDTDNLETFDRIRDFALEHHLSYIMLNILTVFPGTGLHQRMAGESRLLNLEPEYLNGLFPTMRYRNMTGAEIYRGYWETLEKLYSWEDLHSKALAVLSSGKFRHRKTGIAFRDKIYATATILKNYILTGDKAKRQLFKDLANLGMRQVVPMDVVVEYLLFVAAANLYVKRMTCLTEDLYREARLSGAEDS